MPKSKMSNNKKTKKINKKLKNKKLNQDAKKDNGIFNFDEQVSLDVPRKKVTKTAQKKKKSKNKRISGRGYDNNIEQDHFIGEDEIKHIDKKKLEKIKKKKLKEKRTKEKELYKEQKKQDKLRRKRANQTNNS